MKGGRKQAATEPFRLVGVEIRPGKQKRVRIRISESYSARPVFMDVHVVNGSRPGPVVFVCAASHGDELNGVEVIRRLVHEVSYEGLRGTLLLIPVVNTLGFYAQSRYLPDRQDLNRYYPGRPHGSSANQIAYAVFEKVIRRANYGIDLHTAARGRTNMPHVRCDMRVPQVRRLAHAFGSEIIYDSPGMEGSLRRAAMKAGIPTILFEAGETLKFELSCIEAGFRGVLNVLSRLGLLDEPVKQPRFRILCGESQWVRAPRGGILIPFVRPGDVVERGTRMGMITTPFGRSVTSIRAPFRGLVASAATIPMVTPGKAVYHILRVPKRFFDRGLIRITHPAGTDGQG